MGRIQSTRITADTNVALTADSPCVYNGFILSPTDTVSAAVTVSVYADNTGTGTANLLARYVCTPSSSVEFHYTDGILCRSGLRLECSSWTNLEMFVLHS
tara:strand:- start:174 stop:473 length:300 start_codon:yes stop_codon:yes gene_type:complete